MTPTKMQAMRKMDTRDLIEVYENLQIVRVKASRGNFKTRKFYSAVNITKLCEDIAAIRAEIMIRLG